MSTHWKGLRPVTLLNKRPSHRCFSVNFVKFLRSPFFIEHLWWLLLNLAQPYRQLLLGITTLKTFVNHTGLWETENLHDLEKHYTNATSTLSMQLNFHNLEVFIDVLSFVKTEIIFEFCDIVLNIADLSKLLFIILCVK